MNRKLLLGVVGLVVITALAITAYSLKDRILSWSRPQTAATQPAAGHQNHGTAGESQTSKDDQVQATERQAPTLEIAPEKQQMIGTQTADVSIRPLRKILRTTGRIEADEQKIATIMPNLRAGSRGSTQTPQEKRFAAAIPSPILQSRPDGNPAGIPQPAAMEEGLSRPGNQSAGGTRCGQHPGRRPPKAAALGHFRRADPAPGETGKPMRTMTLYSPVNGTIVQKNAVLGMRVMPGDKLFDVADLSTLWIIADVYDRTSTWCASGFRPDSPSAPCRAKHSPPRWNTSIRPWPGNPDGKAPVPHRQCRHEPSPQCSRPWN